MSAVDRVARFVDALIRDRRPKRFPADSEESGAIQAAAALRAARPGADLPSPVFVEQLERRLAEQASGGSKPGGGPPLSRRWVLQAAGASAAAAVAGGVVLSRLPDTTKPGAGDNTADDGNRSQDRLNLSDGRWVPVVATSVVGANQAVRFSASSIEGFVINKDGEFDAISAVCTHMGCILKFNVSAGRLDCPCHGASFDLEGAPISAEYLKSLTRLQSRVRDGMVEVQVNRA
jgi:nitrite reductase/ring-hydroxylating ferredoxin subunit